MTSYFIAYCIFAYFFALQVCPLIDTHSSKDFDHVVRGVTFVLAPGWVWLFLLVLMIIFVFSLIGKITTNVRGNDGQS